MQRSSIRASALAQTRWLYTLLALAWGPGCAGTPAARPTTGPGRRGVAADDNGSSAQPRPTVVLVPELGCCEGADRQLLQRLMAQLEQRVVVRRPRVAASAPAPPRGAAARVRAALDSAHEAYRTIDVKKARAALAEAERMVRDSGARDLAPADLARLQLYLGALEQAEGKGARADEHFARAVAFEPAIRLDPEVFSPVIRQAVARARAARRVVNVTIRSIPAGATVVWDGERQANRTPLTLTAQSVGEHYLIIEHPLYLPLTRRTHVDARGELDASLQPHAAPRLLAIALERRDLRREVLQLVGGAGLLRVRARERGLGIALDRPAREGQLGLELDHSAAKGRVQRAAWRLAAALGAEPYVPPRRRRDAKAGFWRRNWWILPLAGAAVAAGIVIPLAASGHDSPRDVRMIQP